MKKKLNLHSEVPTVQIPNLSRISKRGLYNPDNEHDSCGVGVVANINGSKSHDVIKQGLEVLVKDRKSVV